MELKNPKKTKGERTYTRTKTSKEVETQKGESQIIFRIRTQKLAIYWNREETFRFHKTLKLRPKKNNRGKRKISRVQKK